MRGKPFEKGHKGLKPKGVPNKITTDIKQAYKELIERNLDNLTLWLDKIAEKDPEKAIRILSELSEYVVPKLARTESDVKVTVKKLGKDLEEEIYE